MNKTALALLSIFLLATSFQQPGIGFRTKKTPTLIDKSVKARIDATLKSFVDSGKIAGVSALVFEKNKEVYYNAFGHADREAKRPMDRNTIVRIYSMTKPVTGVALMQLYEKGAFQLDDPLAKYLPEFADMKVYKGVDASGNLILEPAKRPITIRDITRHTAGFATSTNLPGLSDLVKQADVMNPANNLREMAKKLAGLPLEFHPGEQWAYGPSVDVQAYLVERISGKPFDQYLQENIFNPLGMTNTRYVVPANDRQKFAGMYRRSTDGQLTRVPDDENTYNIKNWPLKTGGFGLTSTLDDYMKFARMLVNKGKLGKATILKPETVKLMATNQLAESITERMWLPSKGQVGFGIDFAVRLRPPFTKVENNGAVGEFFWDGAASTLFWVDPVNEVTAVLFVQVMPFYGQLHKRFRDAVYGEYSPN
ncbi:MAG: serine hydrolase domain-containing protein [Adhaeribacter sp.]